MPAIGYNGMSNWLCIGMNEGSFYILCINPKAQEIKPLKCESIV